MIRWASGMTIGALAFHQLAAIPAAGWLLASVAGLWLSRRLPGIGPAVAGLCFGFAVAHGQALWRVPAALPVAMLGTDVEVTGVVDSLVAQRGDRVEFAFRVGRIGNAERHLDGDWRLRLNWYRTDVVPLPGETWRFEVRLKPVHGFANPGGFDFEGWLYRQGIRYRGYVSGAFALVDDRKLGIDRARQWLSARIATAVPERRTAAVLRALVVGDRSGLDSATRRGFQRTGTSHLMAISGLHIGLVASSIALMTAFVWRRCPRWCARLPATHAAAVAGVIAAAVYAALAGFTLPTQRALIMVAVAGAALLSRRTVPPWRLLTVALALVLCRDTAAVMATGFWLSFGAVALILAWITRRSDHTRWQWLALQPVIGLGLTPLLFAFGLGVSLSGVILNPPMIGWFGFVVIPLALAGGVLLAPLPSVAEPLLRLAATALTPALDVLALAAQWEPGLRHGVQPGALILVLALVGVALALAPRGLPGRILAPLLIAPLFLATPPRPALAPGEFALTVLDVGQGLAVVVETAHHVLVYDTGNGFPSGFNTGSAVVAPFLRARGWSHVDRVVVSHADKDHAGGLAGLLGELPADRVLSGEVLDPELGTPGPCRRGQSWTWDGVSFAVLHPPADSGLRGNDASCVLRVGRAGHAALLTGDIERRAEASLLGRDGRELRARIATAPHHGSASSSTPPFVAAVGAEHVVYATGYRNRWGFPAAAVRQRWHATGAGELDTAASGAVGFVFRADGRLEGPWRYRQAHARFWMHRPDTSGD